MVKLYFTCPKCGMYFAIHGWWKWILTSPFHFFSRRLTKCPDCGKYSWNKWGAITRD